jgi:hypothetical protein
MYFMWSLGSGTDLDVECVTDSLFGVRYSWREMSFGILRRINLAFHLVSICLGRELIFIRCGPNFTSPLGFK